MIDYDYLRNVQGRITDVLFRISGRDIKRDFYSSIITSFIVEISQFKFKPSPLRVIFYYSLHPGQISPENLDRNLHSVQRIYGDDGHLGRFLLVFIIASTLKTRGNKSRVLYARMKSSLYERANALIYREKSSYRESERL